MAPSLATRGSCATHPTPVNRRDAPHPVNLRDTHHPVILRDTHHPVILRYTLHPVILRVAKRSRRIHLTRSAMPRI